MLFDGFKSVTTLEREIRDWYYEDNVQLMGKKEAYEMRDHFYERPIIEVAKDVMETAYSNYHQGGGSTEENLRYLKAMNLVQKMAKKNRWKLFSEGAPALGYRIEIIEMK